MARTVVIHARRDWTFELVLLGIRLLGGAPQTSHDVADQVMRQPSCCL